MLNNYLCLGGKHCRAGGTSGQGNKQKEAMELTILSINQANTILLQLKMQLEKERKKTKDIAVVLQGINEVQYGQHQIVVRNMKYKHGNEIKNLMVNNAKLKNEQNIVVEQIDKLTKAGETVILDEYQINMKCIELEKQINKLEVESYAKACESIKTITAATTDGSPLWSTQKTTVTDQEQKKPKEIASLQVNNEKVNISVFLCARYTLFLIFLSVLLILKKIMFLF